MADSTADFEAGTDTNTITTGDPGSATAWDDVFIGSGNSVTYDSTYKFGTLAGKCASPGTPTSQTGLYWDSALGDPTDHYGRAYLRFSPTLSEHRFVSFNGNGLEIAFFIRSDGTIYLNDGTGISIDFATTITTNQWFRLEWHIVHSATVGQTEAKLFLNPDSSTATETDSTAANRNTGTDFVAVQFGLIGGGGVTYEGPVWFDNIVAAATNWPGSAVTPTGNLAPVIYGRGAA
jgi:hypothetical protein